MILRPNDNISRLSRTNTVMTELNTAWQLGFLIVHTICGPHCCYVRELVQGIGNHQPVVGSICPEHMVWWGQGLYSLVLIESNVWTHSMLFHVFQHHFLLFVSMYSVSRV